MNIMKKIFANKGIIYTMIILTILCGITFRDFIILKKLYLFNDAGGDTLISYWPHYENLFSKIQQGNFSWWNFNNGIGNTSITRIQELFDPFNSIFYFISPSDIPYILGFIAMLKIILAGLFFYIYLGTFKYKEYTKIIVSILYAFNGYMILWGQHYMFATISVYIPLLLYFYEKWFNEKKYLGFLTIIFLISIFSFYFMYMTSIFLLMYAAIRYLEKYHFNVKEFIKYFFETLKVYMLGLLMSSFVMIPYLNILINNPRVGNVWNQSIFSLNSIHNYLAIIQRMFGNAIVTEGHLSFDSWWDYYESPIMFCGVISLLLIPQILEIKDIRKKKIYVSSIGFMLIMLIFPFFSLIMNGFSATYFRWTYLLITLELYFVAIVFDKVILEGYLNKKLIIYTYIIELGTVISTLFIGYNYNVIDWKLENIHGALKILIISISFMTMYLLLLNLIKYKKYKKYICIILGGLICIEVLVFADYDINKRVLIAPDYIGNYGYYDDSMKAIEYIKYIDNTFYRIDKSFLSQSYADSYIQKFYGLRAYDSTNKPEYIDILRTLNVEENMATLPNFIAGCYSRPKLQTLFGVKYIINKVGESKPAGYRFVKKFNSVNVYINENFMLLGFTYDKVIYRGQFEQNNSIIMDDLLLQSAVIEEDSNYNNYEIIKNGDSLYDKYAHKLYIRNIIGQNINICKNINNRSIEYEALTYDPNLILSMDKFNSDDYSAVEVEFDVNVEKKQEIQLFWETNSYGFSEENSVKKLLNSGDNRVKISINKMHESIEKLRLDIGIPKETIELKNLNVKLIKKENLEELNKYVEILSKDNFVIDNFKEDYIKASIDVDKNKILCFSIPYDKGWHIKIDGLDAKTEKINIGLLSVEVEKGNHIIELKYIPPGFKLGSIITISAIFILISIEFIKRVRLKNNK